ncbi:SDR family NAD(P)-dependent oxidoreductase [Sphingobacterium faecium]|uniref:SDR family NAD(P)-dependent oxidoreductase n=1 Tax=Sphingobacterium faecium TaxID=34087 RepID=UPI003207FA5B
MAIKEGIAVVGMDCRYPGAHSIKQFWENIINLRQEFRLIPEKRLNLNYYYDNDKSASDFTYSKLAAVLEGYKFDRIKYKISKSTFEQTDLTHWLALDVASGAINDAGIDLSNRQIKERTGVIIGNSLTGEFARANLMRLRWPYVYRTLQATLKDIQHEGLDEGLLLAKFEKLYKAPFPIPDADMLAGGLSNTIAGRICNYYNFNGGGYTIDGACSSSLLAISNACEALENNKLDIAIVGGVDLSIDPFELIGFARNGALATNEMEVFSAKSEGFWPGEGCGMVVLMRESYAKKNGYRIYSLIKGCGISSDGNGGMTRPKVETQQLAMRRAYNDAGYDINTVSIFEAHGTGTSVGDEIELTAIVESLKNQERKKPAVIGSVKQIIGHTKAAAGIAGFIKTVLSMDSRIIPPSKKYDTIHPVLERSKEIISTLSKSSRYVENEILRAGISSFGFGGINVHVTLEEPEVNLKNIFKKKDDFVQNIPHKYSNEIFCFFAQNHIELIEKLKKYDAKITYLSRSNFVDLSSSLIQALPSSSQCKLSIVANSVESLKDKLNKAITMLLEGKDLVINSNQGIFFNLSRSKIKTAFLFPGQGVPIREGDGIFEQFVQNSIVKKENNKKFLANTNQHLIIKQILASTEFLSSFGITATLGLGHSLGEIANLAWGGVLSSDHAQKLAYERGNVIEKSLEARGRLLAVRGNLNEFEACTKLFNVFITGFNGRENFVLGGDEQSILNTQRYLLTKNISSSLLKVDYAFHTPLMREAALKFKEIVKEYEFRSPDKVLKSSVTGSYISNTTNIEQYLIDHIENPVRFYSSISELKDEIDVFIELGTGTSLMNSLKGENFELIPLEYAGDSLNGFLKILATYYIGNLNPDLDKLFLNRFSRKIDIETWELDVLINPCELMSDNLEYLDYKANLETVQHIIDEGERMEIDEKLNGFHQINDFVKNLISKKTEIPLSAIQDNDKIMSDLHINSLAVAEIISISTRAFNKDHVTYTHASLIASEDGSIDDLINCISQGASSTFLVDNSLPNLDSLYNWTHVFVRDDIKRDLFYSPNSFKVDSIYVIGENEFSSELRLKLASTDHALGCGAVFIENFEGDQKAYLDRFISFLQTPEVLVSEFVALIQSKRNNFQDLKPILRTFQLEYPNLLTISIDIDTDTIDPVEKIINEIKNRTKYKEVSFVDNIRYESELRLIFPEFNQDINLKTSDVLVVPGGGKGVTYASIKYLAGITFSKIAIIGRSSIEEDIALQQNLKELEHIGIKFKYYSVDIQDEIRVGDCISRIEEELGKITGIIYGAGVNFPVLIKNITFNDFEKTNKVKSDGLNNILKCLAPEQLKLLVGYGSIIAESGMEGNADYAWANDQFAKQIERYSKINPLCKAITIEWSVWEELGMGVNLNTISHLKSKEIYPIPTKNALAILHSLLSDQSIVSGRYLVSGRYGHLTTLQFNRGQLPMGRFVSEIKHYIPKIEIISDVKIDLKSDTYLRHHVINGQFIYPTVMILEGMLQVTSCLVNTISTLKIKNLKIEKPVFIPSDSSVILRFAACLISKDEIHIKVSSDESNFDVVNFEGTVSIEKIVEPEILKLNLQNNTVDFNVQTKFYDDLLFHTGPFRKIDKFHYIDSYQSIGRAKLRADENWFHQNHSQLLILDSPGIIDAIIHCHQACRPSQRLLPTGVKEIKINNLKIPDLVFIYTKELYEEGDNTIVDVYLYDDQYQIIQFWHELVLTQVKGHEFNEKWDLNLLMAHLEYKYRATNHSDQSFVALETKKNLLLSRNITQSDIDIGGRKVNILKMEDSTDLLLHSYEVELHDTTETLVLGIT